MLQRIAVGTDGSGTASKACQFAMDMAERFGAELLIISSYRPVAESRLRREQVEAPDDIQWAINPTEDVDATLKEVAEEAGARGIKTMTAAKEGDPADVLCDLAEEHDADLLVVGNKGMKRRVLGSVPNSVSHNAPCSVVIVKTT
jgi:nucleotide-binding universal stress UspA family protein